MRDLSEFSSYRAGKRSYSEAGQDLFALFTLNEKRGGYFVDFGAGNGILNSNSYLLESEFGWNGIVCEPCKHHHVELRANRACSIDLRCVHTTTDATVEFVEAQDKGLSTITHYVESDQWSEKRKEGAVRYRVDTVTLNDLLIHHHAPAEIDYLSIDTEGSEFHILCHYDFSHRPKVVTIEHNNNAYRGGIRDLMARRGYTRVLEGVCSWEDWYIFKT